MTDEKERLDDFLADAESDVFVVLDAIPTTVFDFITGASLSMPLLSGHKVKVLFRQEGYFMPGQNMAIPFFHKNADFLNGLLRAYGHMNISGVMLKKVKHDYQKDPRLAMSNLSVYATPKDLKKSYVFSGNSGMYLSGLCDGHLSVSNFNGSSVKSARSSFGRLVKGATEVSSNALGSAYVRFNAR